MYGKLKEKGGGETYTAEKWRENGEKRKGTRDNFQEKKDQKRSEKFVGDFFFFFSMIIPYLSPVSPHKKSGICYFFLYLFKFFFIEKFNARMLFRGTGFSEKKT